MINVPGHFRLRDSSNGPETVITTVFGWPSGEIPGRINVHGHFRLQDSSDGPETLITKRVHDEAIRELRKLGRRVGRGGPRASGVGELGALSPREREMAELVAQGYTNKEMAARLFLSENTVESHLSRAFAKLDVRSRSALAARWGAHR